MNAEHEERPQILGPEELVQVLREKHAGGWRLSYRAAMRVVQEQYDFRRAAALSSPHPEAREEAYEIGTPREFAERLAWMAVNGKPDLDQWENHIKFRDAALSRLAAKEGQISDTRERRCSECRFFNSVTGKCKITLEDAGACFVKYGHSLWTPAAPEPRPAEEPMCPECHGRHFVIDPTDGERRKCSLCGPDDKPVGWLSWKAKAIEMERNWQSAAEAYIKEQSMTEALNAELSALRSQLARKDEGQEDWATILSAYWYALRHAQEGMKLFPHEYADYEKLYYSLAKKYATAAPEPRPAEDQLAQKDEGMREALERSTYHLRRRLPQCGKQDMTNADRDLVEWCETDVPEIIRRAALREPDGRKGE